MHMRHIPRKMISGLSLVLVIVFPAYNTYAETLTFSRQAYSLDSGVHDGVVDGFKIAFQQVVRLDGTRWLRLHFGSYHLGKKSYITITSLKDAAIQRLDEKSLGDYNNSSAYFNGDSVKIQLHVANGETGIYFRLEEITMGEPRSDISAKDAVNAPEFAGICGTDDRVSTADPRIGRIWSGGTVFIVSNGAILSAGHNELNMSSLIEFNVPPSDCNGDQNHADPKDQYPVDFPFGGDYPIEVDDDNGNDYTVFRCRPNSNTGLLPVQAQAAFYRLSLDETPTTVRVTGYGEDTDPPGCDAPTWSFNEENATLQTHSGNYLGEVSESPSRVYIKYDVDTSNGASGSPVIAENSGLVIGIHTTGDCPEHKGTSFENDGLEQAIQEIEGQNVVYVDKGHPVGLQNGSVFRPYDTLVEGVTAAIPGGTVSIVTGSYDESIVIGKPITLSAPVGNAIIGQ